MWESMGRERRPGILATMKLADDPEQVRPFHGASASFPAAGGSGQAFTLGQPDATISTSSFLRFQPVSTGFPLVDLSRRKPVETGWMVPPLGRTDSPTLKSWPIPAFGGASPVNGAAGTLQPRCLLDRDRIVDCDNASATPMHMIADWFSTHPIPRRFSVVRRRRRIRSGVYS